MIPLANSATQENFFSRFLLICRLVSGFGLFSRGTRACFSRPMGYFIRGGVPRPAAFETEPPASLEPGKLGDCPQPIELPGSNLNGDQPGCDSL
jgi:hypothetical protein